MAPLRSALMRSSARCIVQGSGSLSSMSPPRKNASNAEAAARQSASGPGVGAASVTKAAAASSYSGRAPEPAPSTAAPSAASAPSCRANTAGGSAGVTGSRAASRVCACGNDSRSSSSAVSKGTPSTPTAGAPMACSTISDVRNEGPSPSEAGGVTVTHTGRPERRAASTAARMSASEVSRSASKNDAPPRCSARTCARYA